VKPANGPAPRSRLHDWGAALLVLAVLAVVLVLSQAVPFTPIDPVRGTPQKVQPILLWVIGSYGIQTTSISGVSTDFGNTLLLNSVASKVNATASWNIPFPVSYDLSGKSVNVTAWLPAFQPPSVGPTPLILGESKSMPVSLTVWAIT